MKLILCTTEVNGVHGEGLPFFTVKNIQTHNTILLHNSRSRIIWEPAASAHAQIIISPQIVLSAKTLGFRRTEFVEISAIERYSIYIWYKFVDWTSVFITTRQFCTFVTYLGGFLSYFSTWKYMVLTLQWPALLTDDTTADSSARPGRISGRKKSVRTAILPDWLSNWSITH